jgi:hypothetical protein
MAMGLPVLSQQRQGSIGQRDIAILPTLPFTCTVPQVLCVNVDKHAITVQICNLQLNPFAQAQSTGVNRAQADMVAKAVNIVPMPLRETDQHAADFLLAQNHRQLLFLGRPHQVEGLPISPHGVLEKELDPTESLSAGAAGSLPYILQIEKVLAQILLCDVLGRLLEVLRQLAHGPQIGFLRFGGETPQLQVLDHTLS